MVLLCFDVAQSKVDTDHDFNLLDQFDSLLLSGDDRVLVHREEHFEAEERLIVVFNCLFWVALLEGQVTIESLDVGHFQLVLRRHHWIVIDYNALL